MMILFRGSVKYIYADYHTVAEWKRVDLIILLTQAVDPVHTNIRSLKDNHGHEHW